MGFLPKVRTSRDSSPGLTKIFVVSTHFPAEKRERERAFA